MRLGLQDDNTLEVPPNGFPAGWYTGAPTPGEVGPAILVGHVHWGGTDGVFARLQQLKSGDQVLVARKNGSVAVFEVSQVKQYPKKQFPTDAVYGEIGRPGLRLITCGGFDPQTSTYDDNVVVFADFVSART